MITNRFCSKCLLILRVTHLERVHNGNQVCLECLDTEELQEAAIPSPSALMHAERFSKLGKSKQSQPNTAAEHRRWSAFVCIRNGKLADMEERNTWNSKSYFLAT